MPCPLTSQPHCAPPTTQSTSTSAPLDSYQQQHTNARLNPGIQQPHYPSNARRQNRQTTVITSPSQPFTLDAPPQPVRTAQQPALNYSHQANPIQARGTSSNSLTLDNAAPDLSQHRTDVAADSTDMTGRRDHTSSNATMPPNIQPSASSETSSNSQRTQQPVVPGQDLLGPGEAYHFNDDSLYAGSAASNPQSIYYGEAAPHYTFVPPDYQHMFYPMPSQPSDPAGNPFPPPEPNQQVDLEQHRDTQGNNQNREPFNANAHDGGDYLAGPHLNHAHPTPHNYNSQLQTSSTLAPNDIGSDPLPFTFPGQYVGPRFVQRALNQNIYLPPEFRDPAPSIPYSSSPPESQPSVSNPNPRRRPLHGPAASPSSSGLANAFAYPANRRRSRRSQDGGSSQSGATSRIDTQRPSHRHAYHQTYNPVLFGPSGPPREQNISSSHLARLIYSGALPHPDDPDIVYLGNDAERRRRFLQSLSSPQVEPVPPTKGLDNQNDGRPEPKDGEELMVNLECKACMSQLIDTVVLPCGHAVLCRWCADQHMPSSGMDKTKPRGSASCPMCRKPVKQKVCLIAQNLKPNFC
ncbi:hypothetical protein AJ79_03344 [Helicocarpus griseus UAMH5409]|uniref:RING-type domain-containing protein n=1 Tax=Helicocarpus griseus UAMH5409 TaxID=1447875 RepID=A0A2B7XYC8_9EURO|nr:hypothetical protein AJ79_03344 [Helicocarpus griseus UAMH5409]